MYDLNSDFDVIQHAKKYPCYTEVIIKPDGTIEYAVPSHQEKLISILSKERDLNREEIQDMCPPSFFCDFLQWLLNETKCVSVWYEFCIIPSGKITKEQRKSLVLLKNNNCYIGETP